MADPLSVTGLVLQLGALVKQLYDYGKQVKNARKDINSLCSELLALRGILEDLKDHRADPDSDDEGRLAATLSKTKVLLSDLLRQLEPGLTWQRRARQSLKWPFDKAHIDGVLTDLERLKSALLLVLMGDCRSALANVSDMKVGIAAIQEDVQGVRDIITDEATLRKQQRQDETITKVRDHIAPISPAVAHRKACAVWQGSNSGSWFIHGPLRTWLSDPEPEAHLMVLNGVSGAGKSTIISRAIEECATGAQSIPVAFFYCTYNEASTHDARNVIGSWLVQLSNSVGPTELLDFQEYVDADQEIPIEPLQEAIARIAGEIGPVLLVLDALNESTRLDSLLSAIGQLLRKSKQVRCLLSTTLHIGPTLGSLECPFTTVMMSPDSIEDDIVDYIKRTVEAHEILKTVGEESILRAIVPRTQGMFRWASCQMKILSGCLTVKMVRRALQNLPGSLEDTYVVLLERIPSEPAVKGVVREALLWLTYSLRPLYLSELVEAIAVEVGEKSIDDDCRIRPYHRIVDLCQGLVVWDVDEDQVSLAHSSVATFLDSEFIRSSTVAYFAMSRSEAALSMIRKSLNYILMDVFRIGPCELRTLAQLHMKYPLLGYASTMWAMHAFDVVRVHGDLGEAEAQMILKLFWTHRSLPAASNFAFWIQCLLPSARAPMIQEATPLYYAASFGLTPVVALMFERGEIDVQDPSAPWYIDKPSGRGSATPLNIACFRGHIDVVRILLAHGANPNSVDRPGISGRTWARIRGYRAIARLMRDNGGEEKDVLSVISDRLGIENFKTKQDDILGDDDALPDLILPASWLFKFVKRMEKSLRVPK